MSEIDDALGLFRSGLGAVVTRKILGEARRCIVTYVGSDGTIEVTPIPEGMSELDFGRRFWASWRENLREVWID